MGNVLAYVKFMLMTVRYAVIRRERLIQIDWPVGPQQNVNRLPAQAGQRALQVTFAAAARDDATPNSMSRSYFMA